MIFLLLGIRSICHRHRAGSRESVGQRNVHRRIQFDVCNESKAICSEVIYTFTFYDLGRSAREYWKNGFITIVK